MGSSLKNLGDMPNDVRAEFRHGLYVAQVSQRHVDAKFYGENVKLIERFEDNTCRCIYNVRIDDDRYFLRTLQKKSTSGIAVPKHERETIELRLKAARRLASEKRKRVL